ncbi:hypothetical protein ATO10_12419 [Actibacterium atlanticum]|uniref:Glutamine amidotransferase domain-containing protein n=1 Tax=Actibacterium atlanticum TaxID=1461693 RepID=A0A058ZKS3_9RHOB|nr:membrane protein [Actibacterium atlanticum]KCV81411.1 hypothetical protein ATO10_12419 [Actibacterium atlanticum]
MNGVVIFDPLVPWMVVWILIALAVAYVGLAAWRRLAGWAFRGLAALALLAAIANPSLQSEIRESLSDIVVAVVDETASQRLSDRPAQTNAALTRLRAEVAAMPNTELREVIVTDAPDNGGSLLMGALNQTLNELPRGRVAGVVMFSDGQLHDMAQAPELDAPLHMLLTGRGTDWDRRLIVKSAPAFAIIGEEFTLQLRIEDEGAVPVSQPARVEISIAVDGGEPAFYEVPVGVDLSLPVTLEHGGMNVLQFSLPAAEGELTDRNNAAVVQINGVRDRLRVLLVSGEPHPGERTWRNLLKSDSSVDLVHFTILRPPEKQDGIPVTELSLIAFPTRDLFIEKIDEFDLIIFDRFKRRGILPSAYLDNVRQYVENGGAVLVAAGPDFASADSLFRSPLSDIMPAEPTARVVEEGFRPGITELGERHPVTRGLLQAWQADKGEWGRWFRLIETRSPKGQVVMEGPDERPLLILDRVGEGRVSLLASDHAWLWNRGFEGGGPQLELLRRLAHWMMREPDLEEEALTATAQGQRIQITRRSLEQRDHSVQVLGPDGSTATVQLVETAPGLFTATYVGAQIGLYRLSDGELDAVIALGPAAPREFERTIASGDVVAPMTTATRGGVKALENGVPDLRTVREDRMAHGRGWIGITPRKAFVTADVTLTPLAPIWLMLLLAAAFSLGAWLREGRR